MCIGAINNKDLHYGSDQRALKKPVKRTGFV